MYIVFLFGVIIILSIYINNYIREKDNMNSIMLICTCAFKLIIEHI